MSSGETSVSVNKKLPIPITKASEAGENAPNGDIRLMKKSKHLVHWIDNQNLKNTYKPVSKYIKFTIGPKEAGCISLHTKNITNPVFTYSLEYQGRCTEGAPLAKVTHYLIRSGEQADVFLFNPLDVELEGYLNVIVLSLTTRK